MNEKKMFVYLAGKIDGAALEEVEHIRARISEKLQKEGHTVYCPLGAFRQNCDLTFSKQISQINRAALDRADVFLAYMSADRGYGFGTIREVEHARANHIPTLLLVEEEIESVEAYDLKQALMFDFFGNKKTLLELLEDT